MATKYIVNTKKMAFQFYNGKILDRKGVLAVDEKELEEMEKDYFFASLKQKGVVTVSLVKPSEYSTPGEIIASDNAKISELEEENAKLKARLAELEGIGKDTTEVLDSENSEKNEGEVTVTDTEKKTTSKKGKK